MIHHFKWTAVSNATYYSDIFYPQRLKDEAGILELHEISGAAEVRIQGQLHEDGTWRNLGAAALTASGYESGIPVFPRMRIKVTTSGGFTTLSANFAE